MSWTYTSNPTNRDVDAVRLLVGDTDSTDQQLQDEEIDYFLAQNGNTYAAAITAARTLAAKYARYVDKKVGDLSLSASQKTKHYTDLANTLKQQQAIRGAIPYAGGISISDKNAQEEDTDRVQPLFTRDMDDYTTNSGVLSATS